jgi:hypothetical protein
MPRIASLGRMSRHRAGRRLVALALAGTIAATGCTSSTPDPGCSFPAWRVVQIPAGMTPLSLTAAGSLVLIGGSSPAISPTGTSGNPPVSGTDERTPTLLQLAGADTTATAVPLDPQSPYGRLAQLEFLGTDGTRIAAVGTATGGAHLNPRWSVWTGSASGLTEQPQPMQTFGGWNAGSLTALAYDRSGPLLVGSWSADGGGIGGALWTQSGADWRRTASALPLTGTPADRFLPTGIGTLDTKILVVGFTVAQAGGATSLRPTLWTGDRAGHWQLRAMPDGGAGGVASGIACAAGTCWVPGRIGDRLTLWQVGSAAANPTGSVVGGTDPTSTITEVAGLPVVPLPPGDDTATAATDGAVLVVAVGSAGRLLWRTGGGAWNEIASPAPDLRAASVANGRVTAITGTEVAAQLWRSCRAQPESAEPE